MNFNWSLVFKISKWQPNFYVGSVVTFLQMNLEGTIWFQGALNQPQNSIQSFVVNKTNLNDFCKFLYLIKKIKKITLKFLVCVLWCAIEAFLECMRMDDMDEVHSYMDE